jgi:nucleotide-binding universal stress UspA family protein
MSGSTGGQHRIVVGVDDSEGSKNALRWAARQAEFTGATLEVVTGWDYPAFFGFAPAIPDDIDFSHAAELAQNQTLDDVFGADRPARLETRVVSGHPALVLVEASEGADLLVVGSRGYGGFADAMLGSVSTYCVHHAHCPVTVIRPAGHERK